MVPSQDNSSSDMTTFKHHKYISSTSSKTESNHLSLYQFVRFFMIQLPLGDKAFSQTSEEQRHCICSTHGKRCKHQEPLESSHKSSFFHHLLIFLHNNAYISKDGFKPCLQGPIYTTRTIYNMSKRGDFACATALHLGSFIAA